jgi:hypothetical protein
MKKTIFCKVYQMFVVLFLVLLVVKLRSLEFNFGGEWGMKKRMNWKREKIESFSHLLCPRESETHQD